MRNEIEELIKLYHTDNEVICEGNTTSCRRLPLDKIMENRRMAKEKLLELSKEQLVSYILNKKEVPNELAKKNARSEYTESSVTTFDYV